MITASSTSSESRPGKPTRIARLQGAAVLLLCLAGVINYIDRGSLAIANSTIRGDLGMSATHMGALLSIFSLAYAISQLPMGILLDRFGERIVLGAGMFLWSVTQTATGFVNSFGSFVAARIGLAVGEAPFVVGAVKTVNDWFRVRDRATPMGTVNAATTVGQAIAPPILTVTMLKFGWRGMFMVIGAPGLLLSILWYSLYRDRRRLVFDEQEESWLGGSNSATYGSISFSRWIKLFRLRTVWGMMLGFGGINYTVWFYMSWMPNYLEAAHHVSIAGTGFIAVIPFFCGAVGMQVSGLTADLLVRRGVPPQKAHKILIITGMICSAISTLLVPHIDGAVAAAFGIGMALFFIYFGGNSAWGLVQVLAPAGIVASVATIQNFGSFVCASFAPIITGWLLDRTHSFDITLAICALVSILGALSYLLIVRNPIRLPENGEPSEAAMQVRNR